MLTDTANLDLVYRGFKTVYTGADMEPPAYRDKIVMKVGSTGADETYGWVGNFPSLREWIGPRVVRDTWTPVPSPSATGCSKARSLSAATTSKTTRSGSFG